MDHKNPISGSKGPQVESDSIGSSPDSSTHAAAIALPRTHDAALDFIHEHAGAADKELYTNAAYTRRLRRKVDLLVMPFFLLCYCMNFLDKVLLNYAAVMGLSQDLKLRNNDFANASSAFYIAVLCAMVPNIYLLQRLPVGKWLGASLAVWGVCTACHAAVQNYHGLLTVRVLCGLFEGAIPSSLMLLSSQWYTRNEQATRFSYWYCGMGVGQILGGLFSYAFQHVQHGPLGSWRLMFLVLGVLTLLLGISIMFCVPDTPMKAWFLTDDEKVNLLEHVRVNQTGIEGKVFQPKHILETVLDFPFWVMFAITLLQGTGGGAIVSFSATILRSFGYSPKHAALLNMPSGVLNICSALFCGFMSRFYGRRWIWTLLVTCLGVLGAALMSWAPRTDRSASLAGIYLANLIIGATPIDYQWITSNTAGHTKRAFVTAMMNAAFAIGNIIGPLTFRAKDAPQYHPAKISLTCTWAASGVLAVILFACYSSVNRSRDKKYGPSSVSPEYDMATEAKAFAGLTDKQNKEFRYTY